MILSLWSEVQVVQMSKGLLSICLGCSSSSFFDIFVEDDLWWKS